MRERNKKVGFSRIFAYCQSPFSYFEHPNTPINTAFYKNALTPNMFNVLSILLDYRHDLQNLFMLFLVFCTKYLLN